MRYKIIYISVINGSTTEEFDSQEELVEFIITIHYLDGKIISIKNID